MHFYCQCLNVTIDVLEINENVESLKEFPLTDLIRFVNLPQEWFECNISSEPIIHVTWQSLFQSISIRDMKVNRCLVCNQFTTITNIETNKTLINKDLLNDKTVKRLYLDPNYSKIAKIILPIKINSLSMTSSPNFQDDTFQRESKLVQQLYRQSIEDADRETEEKIRTYQYEQEQLLETKTEAMYRELDAFLSFMRTIPRYTSNTKTSSILQTSNSYMNENSMESGLGSDIFDATGADTSRHSSTMERTFSERTSNLDDDTSDDPMIDNSGWFIGGDNLSSYATSLPKNIAFRSYSIPQQNVHDSSDEIERIGKSFRELSQSLMCTDGTEVFGDLPSPRLNSRHT